MRKCSKFEHRPTLSVTTKVITTLNSFRELLAQIAESDQELHDLQEKVAELETISQNLEMETQGKDLVDDLRAEITSQALSLQELTEQHRQSLADYEKSQLELDRHKLKKESELTALRESLEESQRLLEFADVEHNILDKALVDNKTAATIAEAAVERVRRELAEVETLLQEERDRNVDSESQLQQKLTRTEDDFAALQLEYDDLLDTKASVEDKVKTFLQDVSKKETQIRDLQEALRIANTDSTEDKLVHLQNSARELEGKVSRRTNQIAVEQAKLQKVEMNLEMANESIAEYEETIVALNGTVSDKEREVDELKTDLVRYTARLEERDTTIASLQDSVNAHLQEAKKLQTQVETASQRCVVLQEQIDFANTLKENQLSELDLKHNRAETVSTEKIKQLTEEISRLKAENLDDLSQLASKHETAIIELEDKIRDLTASIEVQQEAHAEAVEKMRSETKLLEDSLDRATAELACASSNATRSQEAQEESALELSQQKDLVMELHSRLAEASEAARAESEDLQNGIRQGQLQVEELTTKLETAERNLAFETNKVTALSQDVEAKQAELASVQDELRQLVQEHSRLDSKAAEEEIALRNDLDTLRMTCEALRSDISSAQAEHLASMDKVETEKAELVANVDSMAEVLKEARQAAASQQRLVVAHECDLALTKEEIAQISHDRGQHVELAAALEAEKTGFLSRISEMEDQLGLVHHQVTALTSEVSTASLGATDLELKRDAALIEIDRLLAQIMEHDSITDELNATKAAMERELSDALQASTKWQAEYNKLSKQLEEHIIEVKETRNAASAADAAREQLEIDFAKR
jgi:chromosome segregation ATPase